MRRPARLLHRAAAGGGRVRRVGAGLRSAFGTLHGDRRGSVLVVTAAIALVAMGLASIGIDLGGIALARRRAQGAVDLAALVAATDPARADALARRSLADNGYGRTDSVSVSPGLYRADAGLTPAGRFTAGAPSGNAVRILLQTAVRTHLGRFIGLPQMSSIHVTGTAAQAQFANLSIGSGTASLNGGIVNAVLGAMTGTRLSLTALDYTALLSTRVDALRFLDALAAGLGLQPGRYAAVLAAQASLGQVVGALRIAVQNEANGAPALAALGTLLSNLAGSAGSAASLPVARLADLGDATDLLPEGGARGPRLSALDLISEAAHLTNGQRPVALDLGASLPGLLSARLTLAVGERRQSSGWARPGSAQASVYTAQTRLLLDVGITAPLGLGSLSLPLYAEIAPARATLRALTCPWADRRERQAIVDAQPGLLTLAVADVPRSAAAVGGASPDLGRAAALLRLPLLSVRAQARADLGAATSQSLTFTDSDIARHATRSVASNGLTQSLTGSLLRDLTVTVDGTDLGLIGLLKPLLAPALAAAAPAIDEVLDSALRAVGVRVGYADIAVADTLCNRAVLVQ